MDAHKATDRLRAVLALHCDPTEGSRYWIERMREPGRIAPSDIRTMDDLPMLGLMSAVDLRSRPLDDFLPRPARKNRHDLLIVQTGGTLGSPVWTAYSRSEFAEAFVDPFVDSAMHVGFPLGGTWLYVGPTGPHVIGHAARAIAAHTCSACPFMVDFDSRWARKLPAGSFAANRYLHHIVEQAMDVVQSQPVTTIFTTPVVLMELARTMSLSQRNRITGVHYGGMELDPDVLHFAQSEAFANAVHLSGYGNTLFGCCMELDASPHRALCYYPRGDRLVFGVLQNGHIADTGQVTYGKYGSHGQLVFSRIDQTMFITNYVERETATLVAPAAGAPEAFFAPGVESPKSLLASAPPAHLSIY